MKITKELKVFIFLNFLAIVGLCASAITATKLMQVGPFIFPCSNIIFSLLTFPITDIISEIWGKKQAKQTVLISFAAQVFFVFLIQVTLYLPAASFWQKQEAYQAILGAGPRILVASMVAFLTAQYWDVLIYAWLKKVSRGRFLWLRNNFSTFTSQLINSSLFIFIAFYGQQPIQKIIVGSVLLKWIIATIDTPLVYGGVYFINNYLKGKTLAYNESS